MFPAGFSRLTSDSASGPHWMDALLASAMVLALAWHIYSPFDLRIPLTTVGDAYSAQYIFKTIIEHGSYLRNPDLGAPFGATMYDYPIPEPTLHLMIRLIGVFTSDHFLAFNVFYLLSFVTATLSAWWAFARSGVNRALSVACAIVFALLPYHFVSRGAWHFPTFACNGCPRGVAGEG